MDFDYFVEGPLLWLAFIVFITGILTRTVFFIYVILKRVGNSSNEFRLRYILVIFGRWLVPLHKVLIKKPVYTVTRYLFHTCMVVLPIWVAGHISMWEESRFEWSWTPLPDSVENWMMLIFLWLACFILIRRIIYSIIHRSFSIKDYVLIVIATLPILSGYCLMHYTFLNDISFFDENMLIIHELSGEAMLIMIAFLFIRARLFEKICTACGACALGCPTGAIDFGDKGKLRKIRYSHYQCICCASCVSLCPESAAVLRHDISFSRFFRVSSKEEIRSAELAVCEKCNKLFAPKAQIEKINRTINDDYIFLCPLCKETMHGEHFYQQSPWIKNIKRQALP